MDICLSWLNAYLDPGSVSADEAARILTHAGYPVESMRTTEAGDTVLDVEITSNRGDLFSHVGCAREIAAARSAVEPRRLVLPAFDPPAAGARIADDLALENRSKELCPRFTARLIRSCRVGPSPEWLVRWLEAVGQRSINNAVDVTNFITFELGNPCHVFDRSKLAGSRLIVRHAEDGEALTTLDGKPRALKPSDLVVADADGAQSLAGVIGGQDSQVDSGTTDIVFEMATWDPVTVRTQARRLAIRTDASFRFERIVDPRTIDFAADRAAALLCELTAGTLAADVLDEGGPEPVTEPIIVRPSRVREVVGVPLPDEQAVSVLEAHEVKVDSTSPDRLACTPPAFRPDLTREIDLIEEVARTIGYDAIPMTERLSIRATPPQPEERARRALADALVGLGFWETVTFSFVRPEHASPWYARTLKEVRVDDDRRGAEPTLRPSVVPSLLACRKANADAQVERPGGLRLFELSAVFAQTDAGASAERRVLTLLMDVEGTQPGKPPTLEQRQTALRAVRGAVEAVGLAAAGPAAVLRVQPEEAPCQGWDDDGHGTLAIEGSIVGRFGPVAQACLDAAGLDRPQMAAELDLDALFAAGPPRGRVEALPTFPAIERDVSLIVPDGVAWAALEAAMLDADLEHLESVAFQGVFRSEAIGSGKKSVTARVRFRSSHGTLRHEDVDPQMGRAVSAAETAFGARVRG